LVHCEPDTGTSKALLPPAEAAARATNYEKPGVLDTLAAAYAATTRTDKAVETARRAEEIARIAHATSLADEVHERLLLYQRGQPFRSRAGPKPVSPPSFSIKQGL
jgi:hypothetical protein